MLSLSHRLPLEKASPTHTFYAAVARKDLKNYPEVRFRIEEALSCEETLKSMTISAYFNFEENKNGSIEKGKFANFTIIDRDIMKIPVDSIPKAKVMATFINGECLFKRK